MSAKAPAALPSVFTIVTDEACDATGAPIPLWRFRADSHARYVLAETEYQEHAGQPPRLTITLIRALEQEEDELAR